jgi:hypothetical protein
MFEVYRDLGQLILLDDIDDLGKYSFDGHPSPIHHWQWGLLLMMVAELADTLAMVSSIGGNDEQSH